MKTRPKAVTSILAGAVLAIAGTAAATAFKNVFGAPNYGLGIVIAATVACYLYGIRSAVTCFALAAFGVIYLLIPPVYTLKFVSQAEVMRLATVAITAAITCFLVVRLRSTEHEVRKQNARLDQQNEELEVQNEELQAMNEELQVAEQEVSAQNEELQAQNEELQVLTEELKSTEEQLTEALDHESRIARSLQAAFLPEVPSRIGSFDISVSYEAGSHEADIGGDFYDVYPIDEDHVSIVIGDASGKGLQAARQAIAAKQGLRFCSTMCESPSACLRTLNDFLIRDPDFSGFVTLFHGILDVRSGKLTYCTGGHEPPVLRRESTGEVIRLEPNGRFVGLTGGGAFQDSSIDLLPGDRVLLFTDGLSEARSNGELFGSDGLAKALADAADNGAPNVLAEIVREARDHAGGVFLDDAAAIILSAEEE